MKKLLFICLFFLGCSSTLEDKKCTFVNQKQVGEETHIIYECKSKLDKKDCNIIEDNKCVYVHERNYPFR